MCWSTGGNIRQIWPIRRLSWHKRMQPCVLIQSAETSLRMVACLPETVSFKVFLPAKADLATDATHERTEGIIVQAATALLCPTAPPTDRRNKRSIGWFEKGLRDLIDDALGGGLKEALVGWMAERGWRVGTCVAWHQAQISDEI